MLLPGIELLTFENFDESFITGHEPENGYSLVFHTLECFQLFIQIFKER